MGDGVPIATPRRLLLYTMHLECDTIFNHAQHQPETPRQMAELEWAYNTVDLLPELELESTWPADASLPPFVFRSNL